VEQVSVDDETIYDINTEEIKETIFKASVSEALPFAVFKVTGIAKSSLLNKMNRNQTLTQDETDLMYAAKNRIESIVQVAHQHDVRLFIDAEETWYQNAIDKLALEMMEKYNREKAIVFNTIQCYRTDALELTRKTIELAKQKDFYVGLKLVRGAYMEKEREVAKKEGRKSPIQPDLESTHACYNDCVQLCFDERDITSICAGTHNTESCEKLVQMIIDAELDPNDDRFWFAQLYGMSDPLSFNLAANGYNSAKYLPYGPVSSVLPYLSRRAEENSSVSDQVSRELTWIKKEIQRRNSN
jgi:proline dehydrogenase